MAEASVAVKNPAKIPPMTITNNIKLGIALMNTRAASGNATLSPTGYPFLTAKIAATSIMDIPVSIPGR
ncbi:hypothetical protein EVA_15314 [gut metagenome]|uniref:Uncharacterized protein n=1 Tax=gut metagenome TaxID=749906 RepID=J9FQ39_9ZZZZ